MSLILTLLLSAVLIFLLALWPVKKSAEWFHAQYPTYGRSAIAIALVLLSSLLAIWLAIQGGLHPLIVLAGVYLLAAFIYARVLGTSFLRGAGIAIVSYLIGAVIQLVLSLVLGSLMSGFLVNGMSDMDTGELTLSQAVDAVCACGADPDCQADRSATLVMVAMQSAGKLDKKEMQTQMKRAEYCTLHPATLQQQDNLDDATAAPASQAAGEPSRPKSTPPPSALPPQVPMQPDEGISTLDDQAAEHPESEPVQVAPQPRQPPPADYTTIDLAEVGQHLGQPAKVIEKGSGRVHQGVLVRSDEEDAVNLQHKLYGGYFSAYIRLDNIETIQVLDTEYTRRQQAYLQQDTSASDRPSSSP